MRLYFTLRRSPRCCKLSPRFVSTVGQKVADFSTNQWILVISLRSSNIPPGDLLLEKSLSSKSTEVSSSRSFFVLFVVVSLSFGEHALKSPVKIGAKTKATDDEPRRASPADERRIRGDWTRARVFHSLSVRRSTIGKLFHLHAPFFTRSFLFFRTTADCLPLRRRSRIPRRMKRGNLG